MILREEEVVLTVFQMVDLWKSGCRCPARAVGLSGDKVEEEEQAQALVTGIMVISLCAVHDPEHANADGLWRGGEVDGVVAAVWKGDVQVLVPSFGAGVDDGGASARRLARRVRGWLRR